MLSLVPCTNSIEDLRAAAAVLKGKKRAPGVWAMWCGTGKHSKVRAQKLNGKELTKFSKLPAGNGETPAALSLFSNERRHSRRTRSLYLGCTNRNFEGRQGVQTRTHLASPQMVKALASVKGFIADIREE